MPRIGIGTLILLAALVLPRSGMAKTAAPISQMYGEGGDVCTDKKAPLLTAGELFTSNRSWPLQVSDYGRVISRQRVFAAAIMS